MRANYFTKMSFRKDNLKVFYSIVCLYSVAVMYYFTAREFSFEMLFHDKSMFENIFSVNSKSPIATSVYAVSAFPTMAIFASLPIVVLLSSAFCHFFKSLFRAFHVLIPGVFILVFKLFRFSIFKKRLLVDAIAFTRAIFSFAPIGHKGVLT